MEKKLSHIDDDGKATMVDVGAKAVTERMAVATGKIIFPPEVFESLNKAGFTGAKGSIIQTAVIAGIQGVKQTSGLIPLCHPLMLNKIDIDIRPELNILNICCTVKCTGKTGVEMEALTGVSVAALTIYDMCKALSHKIEISDIRLKQKTGGKSEFNN